MQEDKFCLKWNEFNSNVSSSFGLLRNEEYLHDVTLVTVDRQQVHAHKLVLSACSEYFQDIFRNNKSSNLMLCLEGINRNDLNKFLDYMYLGEVQICQNDLDRFLTLSKRFKLNGLMTDETKLNDDTAKTDLPKIEDNMHFDEVAESEYEENNSDRSVAIKRPIQIVNRGGFQTDFSEYIEELSDGNYRCVMCGKVSNGKLKHHRLYNLKKHVEVHIDGLSYPCTKCDKTFRSKTTYNTHQTKGCKS